MLRRYHTKGFTLIEIMLVVALIGIMASLVSFQFAGQNPQQKLQLQAEKFVALFSAASDYALLNNVELGVVVTEQDYQFLGYDGVRWSPIPEQDFLLHTELPKDMLLTLSLDDLPIEQPPLVDAEFLQQQQELRAEEDDFKEQQQAKVYPQIYILSGGDITPFSLTFSYNDEHPEWQQWAYRVTGIDALPLKLEGPELND